LKIGGKERHGELGAASVPALPDGETGKSVMDREQRRNVTGGIASSAIASGLIMTRRNA